MNPLGIDVAKAKLDVCLLLEDGHPRTKVVPNTAVGFERLLAWCVKHKALPGQLHAVMESTGGYHEPVARALIEAGMRVSVVNPARVRAFAKSQGILSKNDGLDAFALARFGKVSDPEPWTPPAPEWGTLQALLQRREALEEDLQRETNRQEKDAFTQTPAMVRNSLRKHRDDLEQEIQRLTQEIDRHIDPHPDLKKDRALLQSIPGVGPKVSAVMLVNLRQGRFACAEQLAAYLGLVPVERQSGSSVKGKARLSKNGPPEVRAILYMAAVVARKCNPHIRNMAERLAQRGKCKMAILGAAMRKLVHLCFGVLKNQLPYQPLYSQKS